MPYSLIGNPKDRKTQQILDIIRFFGYDISLVEEISNPDNLFNEGLRLVGHDGTVLYGFDLIADNLVPKSYREGNIETSRLKRLVEA